MPGEVAIARVLWALPAEGRRKKSATSEGFKPNYPPGGRSGGLLYLKWVEQKGVLNRMKDKPLARRAVLSNKGRIMNKRVISVSRDVMGGTPVFVGTRVPVQTLIDYLEGGESVDDFLDGFPTVKRRQIIAFLEQAKTLAVHAAA